MTGKDLFEAMQHVDDDLVSEAEEKAWRGKRRGFPARYWYAAAACLCVLVISLTAVTLVSRSGSNAMSGGASPDMAEESQGASGSAPGSASEQAAASDVQKDAGAEEDAPAEGEAGYADGEALPRFRYTGDDPVLKAVSDHLVEEEADSYYEAEGSIYIPAPVIFQQAEKDGELLVFGNFWGFGYVKNENVLESTSGGEMPACFHLRENDGGYTVTQVDRTGDGSEYLKGIKEFTKGFPGLWRSYTGLSDEEIEQVRKEWIRMYVKDNGLDVTQYRDPGRDPVEIAP